MLESSLVEVLNDVVDNTSEPLLETLEDPVELSKSLHKSLLQLKANFLREDGTTNYAGLREAATFAKFETHCQQLHLVNLAQLCNNNDDNNSNSSRVKAFFLNIYNTLTTHALAKIVTTETTVLELEKFWQKYAYRIGQYIFSLDDIEHGVLRCNKLHPTYNDYFFKEGDPRRHFVCPTLDPRIHFGLNCGAKSCPPIRLFSAENLEKGLELAGKNFCQSETSVLPQEKCVILSKIFFWYGSDFGDDEKAIVQRVMEYLSPEQRGQLENLLQEVDFTVKYADYDWSIH